MIIKPELEINRNHAGASTIPLLTIGLTETNFHQKKSFTRVIYQETQSTTSCCIFGGNFSFLIFNGQLKGKRVPERENS